MKVFCGGLPWEVDNVRLKQVFSEFGPVMDAIVVYDKETGRSRGFGFVTFSDEADAQRMIQEGSVEVDGRTVRIDHANDKKQSFGGARDGGGDRGGFRDEPRFEERRNGRRSSRGQDKY